MVIAKRTSRNVAYKAAKLAESVFAGQPVILTRQVATKGLSSGEADLEDLGRDADDLYLAVFLIYIFNQERR